MLIMKKIIPFLMAGLLLMTTLQSCKKKTDYTAPAAFTMIDAVVNTNLVVTEFGINEKTYISFGKFLRYGEHSPYVPLSLPPGTHRVNMYNYPDTTAHDAPLTSVSFEVKQAEMYTLFFVGEKSNADTMLVKEDFPIHLYGDSSFSVRFLNLAPGTNPVRIEVDGIAQPVVEGLAFKARGPWITFSAKAGVGDYIVKFIDETTNAVLTTYTIEDPARNDDGATNTNNIWRQKNVTIAMIGSPDIPSGKFALNSFVIVHRFPS
jgi:hypothetical protein